MGKFTVFKDRAGEYRFNLKADSHEIIGQSEGYASKQGAYSGIESVRINAPYDFRYERFNDIRGEYRFRLKAANGEIILASEGYQSSSGRDNGIESVKANAPSAPIVENAFLTGAL
jgi:uncharacterized protein YegP (UPF0339 family)